MLIILVLIQNPVDVCESDYWDDTKYDNGVLIKLVTSSIDCNSFNFSTHRTLTLPFRTNFVRSRGR